MPEVKLSITPIEGSPGNYKVQISGSGFEFAANKEVRWKLMDDDPISDDEITDPRGSGVVRSDGTFNFTGNATGENLNDDWGKDEIYAVVSIVGMGTTSSTTLTGSVATTEIRLQSLFKSDFLILSDSASSLG